MSGLHKDRRLGRNNVIYFLYGSTGIVLECDEESCLIKGETTGCLDTDCFEPIDIELKNRH